MSDKINKLTETHPDNVYFDTKVISWNVPPEDNEGNNGTYGVIRPGFNETFPTPETGERIWLHEPTGDQRLIVNVLDGEGEVVSSHVLQGEGRVHVMGGRNINVVTPSDQLEVAYMCDYPGAEPDNH